MRQLPMWRRYLRFLGPNVQEDVHDELRFHLEMRAQELIDAGIQPEAARAEALRQFGDLRHVEQELRAIGERRERVVRWTERLEVVSASVRHALRRMRRSPGFALAVVLTFALGIGANAVMFDIVDRLLLRPPAHVAEPDRVSHALIERFVSNTGSRDTFDTFTYPEYQALVRARSFSAAGFADRTLTLGRGKDARQVDAVLATGNYFSVLSVRPALGRFFGPADDQVGAVGTAVLSYTHWQSAYGGDPGVVGRTLDFGYGPYEIIGVAPRQFNGTELRRVDLWLPLLLAMGQLQGKTWDWANSQGWDFLRVVSRRADGVTPNAVEAEATVLHNQARASGGEDRKDAEPRVLTSTVNGAGRGDLARAAQVATWLLGVSILVLLIACANVANLLLARAIRDRREVGIRVALGGPRSRVIGQLLTESLVLSAIGGLAALAVAYWGGETVRAVLLPDVFWAESPVTGRVLALVLGLALAAGLAAGLLPSVQASRPDVAEALKSGSARTHSGQGWHTRSTLLVLQATLSVVLLTGAGLFVRSLHRVNNLDLGLDPHGVLLVRPIFEPDVPRERVADFFRKASEQLTALPGVEAASPDNSPPFLAWMGIRLRVPGLDSVPRLPTGGATIHVVEPDYFELLRLRIVRGRALDHDDVLGAPRVALVNETMARVLWPGQEAIGKCLIIDDDPEVPGEPPCAEVVGVVENARQSSLVEGARMSYYVSTAQKVIDVSPRVHLVRVRGDVERSMSMIRQALLQIDPAIRHIELKQLDEFIQPQARPWRLGATMFSLFGLLALLVAAVGLYSILAFAVAERRFELGIRAALGATTGRLMGMVLGQALRLVVIGIAVGTLLALAAGGTLEPLLFEVSARDPMVMVSVVFTLLFTGAVAAWIPSRHATRVDPATALRTD